MFAVIKTGGKQYRVAKDQVLAVERLAGDAGETVTLDSVMMVGEGDKTTVGAPFVDGACVAAEIVEQGRGPKIIVFKKQRRKNFRRRNGHRQDLTILRVTEILTDGKKPSAKAAAKPKPEAKAEAPAEDAVSEDTAPADTAAAEAEAEAPTKAPAKKAATKKKAPAKKAAKKTAAKKAKSDDSAENEE